MPITIKRGGSAYSFEYKFAGMRKSQNWIIYPISDNIVKIQSDTRIADFDSTTGKGRMSQPKQGGARSYELLIAPEFQFPQEVVDAINAAPELRGTQAVYDGTVAKYQ
jgi:hypothetical protein